MVLVNRFWENAASIAETAEQTLQAGGTHSEMTILIGPTGGIHMIAGSDWPLDSLRAEHGAKMAYRVTQQEASVRIEGRAGTQTCLFESAKPDGAARLLLEHDPQYEVIQPALGTYEPHCAALTRYPNKWLAPLCYPGEDEPGDSNHDSCTHHGGAGEADALDDTSFEPGDSSLRG